MARIEADGYRLLADLGAPAPLSVRTVGGGASNTAWTRIRGSALRVPIIEPRHSEAAYGAALLAAGRVPQ
jgi:sugar (pentulose or hexulose) kinase